jgi:hypothetical protein
MEDSLQLIYLHSTMLQDIVQEALLQDENPLDDIITLAANLG